MIFVAGENLIDFIADEKNNYKPFVGGSTLNTALSLGRLKSKVYFFSRISNDYFGRLIQKKLKESQVNISLIQKTNNQTTLAIVSNKKNPEFNFYSNETAFRNFKKYSLDKKFIKKIKLSHFSSISLALNPSADTFLKMMKEIKKNSQSIISLDPNIRPTIIENKKKYLSKLSNYMKLADIIKMSDEDYNYISKKKYDVQIKEWMQFFSIKLFVLTRGPKGSILYTRKKKIIKKINKINIIDTVGAGDTFIAGLIFYLNKARMLDINSFENITKKNWLNCLNFASKVAELNCLKAGCEPPYLNDVKKTIKIDI